MGRARTWLVGAAAVLAVVLVAAGAVTWVSLLRPATNPPSPACRPPATDRATVVVAGSSSVKGTHGADWVDDVRGRLGAPAEVVNAGVNGDTTQGLLARLDADVLACRPEAVAVLIGANDARTDVPVEVFRGRLTTLAHRVRAGGADLALLSLPPQGEVLDTSANRTVAEYNRVVADVAARTGSVHLPVGERLVDVLRAAPGPRTPGRFTQVIAVRSGVEHHLLGRSWDDVADGNGLVLLTDHLHLADRAGVVLTDAVAGWLENRGR